MLRFPVPGAPLTPTDNERTLMKPLIRILEKGGIRWGIGCADWLPIDPQHCAAEIGLNLRHVKLSEIGDTAESKTFFDEFADPEAPCLFLFFPTSTFPSLRPGTTRRSERQCAGSSCAGLHASPRHMDIISS